MDKNSKTQFSTDIVISKWDVIYLKNGEVVYTQVDKWRLCNLVEQMLSDKLVIISAVCVQS